MTSDASGTNRATSDTRHTHGFECYCESCCATAANWYEWRSTDKTVASGSRYWTQADARLDREAARLDELPILVHMSAQGGCDE